MPYVILILCIIFINTIFPQKSKKPKNDLEINFNKQNITWNWFDRFNYNFNNNYYGIEFRQNFNSKLVALSKKNKNWRDENNFIGFAFRKFSNFETGIYTKSWLLSDRQSSVKNLFSNHVLGIKSNYSPKYNLKISPYIGYQQAKKVTPIRNYDDLGWDVGLVGEYNNFVLDNYIGSFETEFDYDIYPNRQNSKYGLQLDFKTNFTPLTSDSISTYLNKSKKQFYIPVKKLSKDSSTFFIIDSLINVDYEEKYIHNFLHYQLSSNSNLAMQTILSSKNIYDNSRAISSRDVFKIENRLNLFFKFYGFTTNFGFDTFQETQNNTDINTDSEALQSNIRSNINYFISPKDQLKFRFTLSKYQYDTPDSSDNNDDRDELRIVGGLEYERLFSSSLRLKLEAYINFFHQVYIFKEKSSNNNWNRVFRLSSLIKYRSKKFSNTLRNEILANYTVYDFEQLFSESQSYIFRKYILEDSLTFNIFQKLKPGIRVRYEFEDKGSFFKSEFAQQILQSSESIYLDLYLKFKKIYLLDFESGIAIYNRNDWRHLPVKSLIRDVNNIMPYVRLKYNFNENLIFYSSASYVFSNILDIGKSTYTNGSLTLLHRF